MKLRHLVFILSLAVLIVAFSSGLTLAQDDDAGESEVTVSLDDTPDAVKATLLKELAAALNLEIESEVEGGVTVYDAEFDHNGQEIEFEISADGELLETETGDDEEEEDDDA